MIRLCTSGFAAMFVVAACAMGGGPGADRVIDAPPGGHKDAHFVTDDARLPIDAHVYHDAMPTHDAPPVDAGGGGGFCQVNSDCPVSTQCCYIAICVNGTRVGNNLCFPM